MPDGRILLDVGGEEQNAILRVEIDDFDVESAEPVDAALEGAGFSDNDASKTELPDESAAVPAGSERGDHRKFAIGALATGVAEGIGFSVERRVAKLQAAVVPGAEKSAVFIENCGADGDAAFGKALTGFGESDREHRGVIESIFHFRNYTRFVRAARLASPAKLDEEKCGSMTRDCARELKR